MKIALFASLTKEGSEEIVKNACRILTDLGAKLLFPRETGKSFPDFDALVSDTDSVLTQCDAAIAVGGDGTIIHTAAKAASYKKPVLGINAGRLAFMAGLEGSELDLLEKLMNGEYETDRRMMLHAELYKNGVLVTSGECLNDVVISRSDSAGLCDLSVYRGGRKFMGYYADGLIISTPTGSTAYSLSAGGPILEPTIESMIVTPICAHALTARPVILDADSVLDIVCEGRGIPSFSCDGAGQIPMDGECTVRVRRSENSAEIIRIKNDSFLDILRKKM